MPSHPHPILSDLSLFYIINHFGESQSSKVAKKSIISKEKALGVWGPNPCLSWLDSQMAKLAGSIWVNFGKKREEILDNKIEKLGL